MSRKLIALLSLLAFPVAGAQTTPPGAEAFNQFVTAYWELQESSQALMAMMTEKAPDKAKGRALVEQINEDKNKVDRYLEQAIKEGHAVAFYSKARMVQFGDPKNLDLTKKREAACALYGESAKRGLIIGAVAYVNCSNTIPPTPQYEASRTLLRNALNAADIYQDVYPLAITHAYCFERKVEPLQEGEDPLEKMKVWAQPTQLEAEQARAEGFYLLAADYSSPTSSQSQQDLDNAFRAGCQTDGLRLKPKPPKVD